MTIEIPNNIKVIFDKLRSDAQSELPSVNVWTRNNFFSALLAACAGRFRALYQVFLTAIDDAAIPLTAKDEYLEMWSELRGITRLQATYAKGYINFPCTATVTIPEDTVLRDSNGLEYIVQTSNSDSTQVLNLTSLTRVGSIATATTSEPHGLATGQIVTISGAGQAQYNISASITTSSAYTFTYSVEGAPATPATGAILATSRYVSLEIEAAETGSGYNKDGGSTINISTPVPGLNDTGYVTYGGLTGGSDTETDTRLQLRNKLAWQNPIALFSKSFLEQKALELPFVERVFVQEITPGIGDTTIYFTSNTTTDAQPTPVEIASFQSHMAQFRPANMSPDDYILNSASPVQVNVTINSLSPNTGSLKTSINETLREWFNLEVEPGQDINPSHLYGVIYRAVDLELGGSPKSFTLASPSSSVSISLSQKAVLGSVTYT